MAAVEIHGHMVLLDECDLHLLDGRRWHIRTSGHCRYVQRTILVDGRYEGYESLHRAILGCIGSMIVDHVNGDGLDNRRSNLRVCTIAQNMMNKRRYANNKSGLKGVYFDDTSRCRPWRAQIRVAGKKIHLGSFDSPEAAHGAYVVAAEKYHGEFARAA